MGLVLSQDELAKKLDQVRDQKKIVFTNGCFDILHIGHIRYLQQARLQGDVLVVGINSDASVKVLKGPSRPIQDEKDRAEILAALECVSFTTIFNEDNPLELIKKLRPHVLVKGGDWQVAQIIGSDFVLANGGTVRSLQFVDDRSTTQIVAKMKI